MQISNGSKGLWARRTVLKSAALLMGGVTSGATRAQASGKAIKLVIPYPPGGSTDIVGRIFSSVVGQHLGVTIVPDNKGGAAGLIGMQEVARSKPDGLTLGVSGIGTTSLVPLTHKNPPFVFDRDLDVIGHLGAFGSLVLTRNNAPFKTLNELVAHAKSKPGSLAFGTPPSGSPSHLTLEYLKNAAGLDILGVPYKGHTEILNGLMGSEIDLGIVSVPQALELVRAKKLTALAVTSAKRSSALPDVPTVSESGYPGFEATLWNVLVCRKGTDKELLRRINAAINTTFRTPEVMKQLQLQSIDFEPFSLEATQAFVAKEQEKWTRIAKLVNLKPV
jgi:tripartite-type tricarboxylate transporter receptor subunit TctC